MKSILILIVTIFTLTSCQESPEFKFEKDGVSFTSPSGWAITEEENFDDGGYYLSIEKDGFDSSGIITITWVNDSLNLEDYLEAHKSELKNNIIYKNANLVFEPILNNEFNKISSNSTSFKFKLLGLKHEGILHSFHGKGRTYVILKQEAVEDKVKNRLGFKIIEESFIIE